MFSSLPNFYKGKKIFLTGHTGFKGTWMLYWLHSMGAIVKGYSLAPENSFDLYYAINGDQLCDSVIKDIREHETLAREILNFKPDIVFHLAAQPLVRLSYEIPEATFEINAMGTAYVLTAVKQLQQPCTIVLITTDKVYENKEWIYPYRENDRLGGLDPYSASKACAELVIHSYTHSFFAIEKYQQHQKAIAVARAGNVIGGGDWAKDRIIPDIIRAMQVDKAVEVRNPYAVRPWQHVLEPIGGYLLLAMRLCEAPLHYHGAWNFGPIAADNTTVQVVVDKALKVWGSGSYTAPKQANQLHEAGLLKLDISKANAQLHWMPKWDSNIAIQKTIEWYKQFTNGVDASVLLEKDIQAYIHE